MTYHLIGSHRLIKPNPRTTLEKIHHALYQECRNQVDREASSTACDRQLKLEERIGQVDAEKEIPNESFRTGL